MSRPPLALRAPRRNRARLPLIALTALLGAGLAAPVAALAADTQPPALVSGSASAAPTYLDVTLGAKSTVVTFRLTDETGVVLPAVSGDSDLSRETTAPGAVTRISGDAKDGIYQARLTVARGAVGGGWTAVAAGLADTAGNTTPAVPLAKFTVFAFGWDTVAPKLVSSSITPPAVDVTAAAATTTVTLRVTDDYSGARPPVVDVTSPDGAETRSVGTANLVSGDAQDGTYSTSIIVPKGTQAGAWKVTVRALRDYSGNAAAKATDIGTVAVTNTVAPPVPGPGTPTPQAPGPGTPVTPAPAATNAPAPVDQGGVLGTRVTSKALLTFASKTKKVSVTKMGSLAITLKCTGAARCKGSVRLYAKVKGKKVKVVSRRVSVSSGKTAKVTFKLTKKGRTTVRRGKTIKLAASVWTDGTKAAKTKSLSAKRAK